MQPEDWYSIRLADLRDIGWTAAMSTMKLAQLLSERYPEYSWDKIYLMRGKQALPLKLRKAVSIIFKVRPRFKADDVHLTSRRDIIL